MAPKITGTTTNCGKCPFYSYDSGGAYICLKVDEVVLDKEKVAPFCPLPDYPSHIIAELDTTIYVMRKGSEFSSELALFSHIATKLGLNLTARANGIDIPIEQDRTVYLGIDYVRGITLRPFEITFSAGASGLYKLALDAKPPRLMKARDETGKLWHQVDITAPARPA